MVNSVPLDRCFCSITVKASQQKYISWDAGYFGPDNSEVSHLFDSTQIVAHNSFIYATHLHLSTRIVQDLCTCPVDHAESNPQPSASQCIFAETPLPVRYFSIGPKVRN